MRLTSRIGMSGLVLWMISLFRRPNEATERTGTDPKQRNELDAQLQSAIKGSFPASDPYSVGAPSAQTPDRPLHRRPAEIDKRSVDHQAELLDEKRRRLQE